MLNYYYWYSIMTSVILILYNIPLSRLNHKLDFTFLVLIILSIIFSFFLGFINKKKFEYKDFQVTNSKKRELLPIIFILISSIIEFLYFKEIPFINSTINNISNYRDFEGIPVFHVLICMLGMYYSIKYIYMAISFKTNRLFNSICCILINIIMLLYNMRSFFLIDSFIIINLIYSKIKMKKKFNFKIKILIIFLIFIILYFFGLYGNMREINDYNNNSYIEELGEYNYWPDFVPKPYMWTYSYITSPLANINYNIVTENNNLNISGYIYNYLPDSISKRLPNFTKRNYCALERSYFNVSTGFCGSFVNSNLFGIIVFWLVIMLFPILIFKYQIKNSNYYIPFISLYCAIIVFMFFSNMFSYGGTAPALWLSFFALIKKIKRRY